MADRFPQNGQLRNSLRPYSLNVPHKSCFIVKLAVIDSIAIDLAWSVSAAKNF
jgi:hypothetical protein